MHRVYLLFSRFFEKGVMFLFFIVLARGFGAAEFGEFSYYFALAMLVFVLFDNGGDLYQVPLLARYDAGRALFLRLFLIKSTLFCLLLLLVLLSSVDVKMLYLLAAFYLESLISLGRSLLYFRGSYIRESFYHVAEKSVFLVTMLAAGIWLEQIVFMYLAFAIGKLVYVFLLLPKVGNLKIGKDSPGIGHLIRGSWSYILHAALITSMMQLDIVLLKFLEVPFDQIALYGAAMRIIVALMVIPKTLFNSYYPDVARCLTELDHNALRPVLEKGRVTEWGLGLLLMFTVALIGQELTGLMYGEEFFESGILLLLLSPLVLIRFTKFTDSAVLSASDSNRLKFYITVVVAMVNVGLNLLLIREIGIYGALISITLADFLLWMGFRHFSQKVSIAVKPMYPDLLRVLGAFIILYIIVTWLGDYMLVRMALLLILWMAGAFYFLKKYREGLL